MKFSALTNELRTAIVGWAIFLNFSTTVAAQKTCDCGNPSQGTVTCENTQEPFCIVRNGKVDARCESSQGKSGATLQRYVIEKAAGRALTDEEWQNAELQAGLAKGQALVKDAKGNDVLVMMRSTSDFEGAPNFDIQNDRVSALDDYEVVRTIAVLFKTNSSIIDATGKQTIDDAAAWAKRENAMGNAKGWLVEVVGFADTTGNTAKNRGLSERRAKAIIQYLVSVHSLDLRRLVQPFGFGESNPAANNNTAEGRAKNRRVEIRILQNKGFAIKGN